MQLQGKVALITGGSTGIGKITAQLFAREGATVVITDIDAAGGNQTIAAINQEAGSANQGLFLQHDVSREQDWIEVVEQVTRRFGKIDILFNNAGIYIIQPLAEITVETWNKLMAINVTGVFLGLKHVLPRMAQAGRGSVINASSIAGLKGSPGHALYGASKGAVRILTKDAAAEYADKGIRVNSIHPGYITTSMLDYASEATHKSREELQRAYPMGRMGDPAEVAQMVLFLASDNASFSTGAEFVIDGGFTVG